MRAALREAARAELARRNLVRWYGDFATFATRLETQKKSGEITRVQATPLLAKFEANRSGRDIVLKPRQVFVTTWELARDIWFFLTREGAQVVVVCQSMSDDGAIRELSGRISVMLASLRAQGVNTVHPKTATEWVIPSRRASLRIIGAGASEAAAAKKGRALTIHRLHVTELAFFEFGQTTLNAILESVPSAEFGTEVTIESTANGASGPFFERYQAAASGSSPYRAHFFCWLEHPEYRTPLSPGEVLHPQTPREHELIEKHGASAEQLKWYRAKVADKGQDLVDQEYPTDEETCWLTEGRLFFDVERTKALLAQSREPVERRAVGKEGSQGVLRIWRAPQAGRSYIIAVDPSEGVGGDPGAAVVYDRASGEHVATLHGQFSPWEMARLVAEIGLAYGVALLVVERNNHGGSVLQALQREHRYPRIYVGQQGRLGRYTDEISRATALDALHDAHREGRWSSPDRDSLAEMLRFIVKANGRPEAAPGAHDDLVLAHSIAWDVCCKPTVNRAIPQGLVL